MLICEHFYPINLKHVAQQLWKDVALSRLHWQGGSICCSTSRALVPAVMLVGLWFKVIFFFLMGAKSQFANTRATFP